MVDLIYVFLGLLLATIFFGYLMLRRTFTEYKRGVDKGKDGPG